MTNVETRSRAKPLLTMIILYSGVYSFIGAAFIHYTIHRSCPNLVDILLGVAIFVYSAILSYFLFYQWYSCCAEQPSNNYNTGKTKHALFTELFALLLFFALFQVLTGFFSWASAILCIVRGLLYSALHISLKPSSKDGNENDYTGRRYRFMIPMVYGMMEPTIFGSSILLSLYNEDGSLIPYIIPILYFIVWKISLKWSERDVKITNGLFFFCIIGSLALLYYLILIFPRNTYRFSYIVIIKSLSLAVLGSGILGIPGLVEIAQVLRRDWLKDNIAEKDKNKHLYQKTMQTISIVDLISIIIMHFAFTYLDIPLIYFAIYAVLSVIWVLIARSHYAEKQSNPYSGSYVLSIVFPFLPSICLLCCIYDIIPRPHQTLSISHHMMIISAGTHFTIDFGAIKGFGVELNFKEIVGNFWRIRLVGYRTLGLFLSEVLLLFTLALNIGNERTCIIGVLITAELILQVLGYAIFYSNERFKEENE